MKNYILQKIYAEYEKNVKNKNYSFQKFLQFYC